MLRWTLATAALVLATTVARACPDGEYAVSADPLLPGSGVDVISIAGGTVAIASGCPALPARIRETRRGTLVRAVWASCGGASRVRLRALVYPGCLAMEGRFGAGRPRIRRRFVADRRGDACDGIAGIPCPAGQFCEHPPATCEAVDQQGVCVDVPEACLQVYDPVCGCDGVTYSNDCARRAARAQKAYDGACAGRCAEDCDCYRDGTFPGWCDTLMCPACGCAWRCEQSTCVVHIESPVPDPGCDRPG